MGNMYFGPNHGQINVFQQGRRPRRRNNHPILMAIGIAFVIGLLIKFWWVVLICVGIWLGAKWYAKLQQRKVAAAQERAQIAARADAQNEAYLAGDPFGIYGPPEERPPRQPPQV